MTYSKQLVWVVVVLLGAVAPGKLRADEMGCIPVNTTNPGSKTVVTSSCSQTQVVTTATATNSVNAFETTITAELGSGPDLFNESFNLPYASAAVQAAVLQAENDLTSAGATSYSGPTLISSGVSSSRSVSTTSGAPVATGTYFYGTTTTYGPGVILEGNLGLCQGLVADQAGTGEVPEGCSGQGIAFPVLAGQTVINVNADEVFDVAQLTTTTNTTLSSQTYNLDGVAGVSPVPEPTSLSLLGTGLVGMAGAARRRLQRKRSVA
jgi:hypothetical protein